MGVFRPVAGQLYILMAHTESLTDLCLYSLQNRSFISLVNCTDRPVLNITVKTDYARADNDDDNPQHVR